MDYYTYVEQGEDDEPKYITVSDRDIINDYYPYWYEQMCKKYGKEKVDKEYSKIDCIDDFVILHWAWKVEEAICEM